MTGRKRETLTLGATPSGEDCQQVPYTDPVRARAECHAFINQLVRQFGPAPTELCKFKITSNPHDFGTYYEVGIEYQTDNQEAIDFAYKVEANLPELWDAEALTELGLARESA